MKSSWIMKGVIYNLFNESNRLYFNNLIRIFIFLIHGFNKTNFSFMCLYIVIDTHNILWEYIHKWCNYNIVNILSIIIIIDR